MVAVKSFSGFARTPWALANAAAIAPIVSLDRCMVRLITYQIETNCSRFRAFCSHPMANCFFRILWHQLLQLRFCGFMFQERRPGFTVSSSELCPGVGGCHIDNLDSLKAGFEP